ncbi:hypothetical protein BY996DRAFT_6598835 [Phakopsora pachyrhizi]|nr:hypothetical protein BY996DRAFT_6598835 [Phakopsora pachyrhizi]
MKPKYCGGRFGKIGQEKGGAEGRIQWILVDFEEERATMGKNIRHHWNKEQILVVEAKLQELRCGTKADYLL